MSVRAIAATIAAAFAIGCASASSSPSQSSDAGDDAPSIAPEVMAQLQALSPATLPKPPVDVTNKYADDPRAAALGQAFFFDPGFSGKLLDGDDDGSAHTLGKRGDTGKVACAGCHDPKTAFLDDRTLGEAVSLGAGWGRRRAPSLLDVGQAKLVMWDGRRDALYNQPFGPIESPVEMNSGRLYVAEQVFARYRAQYEAIFGAMPPLDDTSRFPVIAADAVGCTPSSVDAQPTCDGAKHGMPGDGAEYDSMSAADQDAVTRVVVNVGKSLGAYERLLTCGSSRFDAWMHGQTSALTASEQRGAALFVTSGCTSCHAGPYLSDQKFHDAGLVPKTVAVVFLDANDQGAATGLAAAIADPLNTHGAYSDGDDGRLPTSVPAEALGAFRTPTLRCVSLRPTFMHTGQLTSLEDVIDFFARGGDQVGYPGANELHALSLDAQEKADLVAFLRSLEGPGPDASLRAPPGH